MILCFWNEIQYLIKWNDCVDLQLTTFSRPGCQANVYRATSTRIPYILVFVCNILLWYALGPDWHAVIYIYDHINCTLCREDNYIIITKELNKGCYFTLWSSNPEKLGDCFQNVISFQIPFPATAIFLCKSVWIFDQPWGYWCPGASAPGHQ